MKTNGIIYFGLAVSLIVAGWLAGGRQAVEAQSVDTVCEWRMFSETVAGTGGSGGSSTANQYGAAYSGQVGIGVYGTSWMYHSCTGDVRRMFDGCGYSAPSGCAVALPVLTPSESAAGFQPDMNKIMP